MKGLEMLFQMQKTRLNSDTCHRIGNHGIDVVTEDGVGVVGLLAVVVILTGCVMNGREQAHVRASENAVASLTRARVQENRRSLKRNQRIS